MNKKLILLILALPLCLMLCLFTATSTVSIAVRVPVTGIEIFGDDIVYLDMDEGDRHLVEYTVYPTNAKNKNVTMSTEKIGDNRLCELEFTDGYIIPKTVGTAKVYLTTADGGFRDSFIVEVYSDSLTAIESTVSDSELLVGEKATISTVFIPEGASDMLVDYLSSDESVARVDNKGVITAVGKGVATITVSSHTNPDIKDTVTVTVSNRDTMDLGASSITTFEGRGRLSISIDADNDYTLTYRAFDKDGREIPSTDFAATFDYTSAANGHVTLDYEFKNTAFIGQITLKITLTSSDEEISKECVISRVEKIQASFDTEGAYGITVGQNTFVYFTVLPEDADLSYSTTLSNNNVTVISVDSGRVIIKADKVGVTKLSLSIKNNENGDTTLIEKDIVVKPRSFVITNGAQTYGDENLLTIGKTNADGTDGKYQINLSYGNINVGDGFLSNIFFTADSYKVSVSNDGTVTITDSSFTGTVSFIGVYEYGGVRMTTAPFSIRCVGDGVNVYSYLDLLKATKENKTVVLRNDIVDDFGYDENGNVVYKEIDSTYDTTYYANIGKEAKIKILLEFKKDVYGNGYAINAHKVAYGLDSAGQLSNSAIFRGPLNFVAMSESEGSMVSVKAQDNVCFAVYENVTLRNIKLYGCTLQESGGQVDLTDLNYVGTTVEVFGDNVNILYSRIANGRTTLRIFGDISDPEKVINVNISNTVLGAAREFILRMGSNCFIDGDITNPAPSIDPNENVTFPVQKDYAEMTDEEKRTYEEKYIKTFVNIKNSVFEDAGIFAIGIDSHFSGGVLADGSTFPKFGSLLESWHDLAKTSYGAKLTFEGDVRIYNWKNLDSVDSSTLIEIVGTTQFESLRFDVKEMVSAIASKDAFKNIVYKSGDTSYVHGGIAFFGGGKNYGIFEAKNYTFKDLNGYEISLSDVNSAYLQIAAGRESFYFLLHDRTTADFLPEDQEKLLESENAYDCIYKN